MFIQGQRIQCCLLSNHYLKSVDFLIQISQEKYRVCSASGSVCIFNSVFQWFLTDIMVVIWSYTSQQGCFPRTHSSAFWNYLEGSSWNLQVLNKTLDLKLPENCHGGVLQFEGRENFQMFLLLNSFAVQPTSIAWTLHHLSAGDTFLDVTLLLPVLHAFLRRIQRVR